MASGFVLRERCAHLLLMAEKDCFLIGIFVPLRVFLFPCDVLLLFWRWSPPFTVCRSACSSPFDGVWSSELSPPSRPSTAPVVHALPFQSLGSHNRLGGHVADSVPTSQASMTLPVPVSGRAPRRSSNPMCRDVFFTRGLARSATYGGYPGPAGTMCVPVDGGGDRVELGPSVSSPCLDI